MKIEMVPIEAIREYERNPRVNESAVGPVAESIKAFGFKVPVIVDADNVLIAGHTRVKAATSLSSGELRVEANPGVKRGGEVVVEGFSDDYFVVEADLNNPNTFADIWVRYSDPNNGYRVRFKGVNVIVWVDRFKDGQITNLGSAGLGSGTTMRVRVYDNAGTDTIKVYQNGTLRLTVTDSVIPAGGVAFSGTGSPKFDNAKIGYDRSSPPDGDIADADIVWDESFGSTTCTVKHDHAGNLIDDCTLVHVYDAWHRLVKVRASNDSDVTIQTAEFDATGRRMNKVVTNSGDFDGTVVYLYSGQRIIETRDGSGNLYQQLIQGTRYIDELILVRVKDKGDLYVHQDANWNVIGLTDLGGHIVERPVYSPYGELTVNQETAPGDYDGDSDVDSTDRSAAEVGGACRGANPTGACRILDLDFDNDVDDADLTLFDTLEQGLAIHPGRIATNVDQPFTHQGLLFDAEIGSYQNRARQYNPSKRRYTKRDPLCVDLSPYLPGGFTSWIQVAQLDIATQGAILRRLVAAYEREREWSRISVCGTNHYESLGSNPASFRDPTGLKFCLDWANFSHIAAKDPVTEKLAPEVGVRYTFVLQEEYI